MTDYADRSTWPLEALALAEKQGMPDHTKFFKVVPWPNPDAYADVIPLPRVRYGDTEMWVPVRVFVGKRPAEKQYVFSYRIPRKPPRNLECKLSTEVDETEAVA